MAFVECGLGCELMTGDLILAIVAYLEMRCEFLEEVAKKSCSSKKLSHMGAENESFVG